MTYDRTSESEDDIDDLNEEDMIYIGDADEVLDAMEAEGDSDSDGEFEPPRNDARVLFGHPPGKSTFCISLHPDNQIFATGTESDKLFIWKINEAVMTSDIDFDDSVIATEFSSDGTFLAGADMAGNIKVLKTTSEPFETIFEYAIGDTQFLFWHNKVNVLFSGSISGDIYVFKIPKGDCKILPGHGSKVNTAVMMHDGMRVAAGYEDGSIRIWDIRTCLVQNQVLADSAVISIDSHIDNNLIIIGTAEGNMSLINATNAKILNTLNVSSESVESVTFYNDPELNIAAAGCLDGTIIIWDVTRNAVRHRIAVNAGVVVLKWLNDAKLISAHLDAVARKHDARTGVTEKEYMGHKRAILDLVISKDKKMFMTSSDDSTALLFEVE